MRRRAIFGKTLPLLLARGAVVLTICWVIFLGVAAAAGLTRILPIGDHRGHVESSGSPSASATTTPTAGQRDRQGGGGPSQGSAPPPGFSMKPGQPPFRGSPLPP